MRSRTRRLLDIQGFEDVDTQDLAPVAPWLRLTFGLCGLLGGIGTLMASPTILLVLALIAALAAASPVHPFDLVYNYGIRYLTGTGPLPRRGAPTRFGCGMGAVLVLVTAWAFSAGHLVVGYALGGMLTFVVLLVSTTDICIPSLIYRTILVLDGVFEDEHGMYPKGSWLRSPHLSAHNPFTGPNGALIYVKTGHLATR